MAELAMGRRRHLTVVIKIGELDAHFRSAAGIFLANTLSQGRVQLWMRRIISQSFPYSL